MAVTEDEYIAALATVAAYRFEHRKDTVKIHHSSVAKQSAGWRSTPNWNEVTCQSCLNSRTKESE